MYEGEAQGKLLGGNLGTLCLLFGTPYMPDLEGSILLLEDDEEVNAVHFDRALQSLIHQPGFEGVQGIAFGKFQRASNMDQDTLTAIVESKAARPYAHRRRRQLRPHHTAVHVPDRWLRQSSCQRRHRPALHRRPLKAVSEDRFRKLRWSARRFAPCQHARPTAPLSAFQPGLVHAKADKRRRSRMRAEMLISARSARAIGWKCDALASHFQARLFQVEVALDAVHDLVPDAASVAQPNQSQALCPEQLDHEALVCGRAFFDTVRIPTKREAKRVRR